MNQFEKALAQVRVLRHQSLVNQRVTGFSGWARLSGGLMALLAGMYLHMSGSLDPQWHLTVWVLVAFVAFSFNIGALFYWFFRDADIRGDWRRLYPLLFSVPPLLVAAALSIKLIHLEMFDLLFGLWLTMYAVTGFTGHRFMPAKLNWVNSYYLVAGLSMLLIPGMAFTASLVAGMIYFIGEAMAGTVLHLDHTREL